MMRRSTARLADPLHLRDRIDGLRRAVARRRFAAFDRLPFAVKWRQTTAALGALGGVSAGNAVHAYRDTGDAFVDMWAAVDGAAREVRWQTYICKADAVGRATLARLEAAHERGVRTELVYDCGGNITGRERLTARLRQLGASVIRHRPFFRYFWKYFASGMQWQLSPALRNHRKILLVDGTTAFTGGLNIGDDYCSKSAGGNGRFRDTHCRVVGPAANDLRVVYEDTIDFKGRRRRQAPGAAKTAAAVAAAVAAASATSTPPPPLLRGARWRQVFSWGRGGAAATAPHFSSLGADSVAAAEQPAPGRRLRLGWQRLRRSLAEAAARQQQQQLLLRQRRASAAEKEQQPSTGRSPPKLLRRAFERWKEKAAGALAKQRRRLSSRRAAASARLFNRGGSGGGASNNNSSSVTVAVRDEDPIPEAVALQASVERVRRSNAVIGDDGSHHHHHHNQETAAAAAALPSAEDLEAFALAGAPRVQVLQCNPHTRDWTLQLALWHVTRSAHRRLWVTTPYYLPHRRLFAAIESAALRGVDVRILAGARATTDPWFMWFASRYVSARLLRAGVRLFEFQGETDTTSANAADASAVARPKQQQQQQQIMHAKTVVCDSVWASVGSYNWDMMSNKNMEVCLTTHFDFAVARELEAHFRADMRLSRELTLEELERRPLLERFASWAAYRLLKLAEWFTFRTYRDADLNST